MKHLGAVVVLSAVALSGLAFLHPFGNPRVESAKGLDTLLRNTNLPADARSVLVTKCADCHSNETRWPVYSRLAPGAWLIERDIVDARKKMNLSNWDKIPADTQAVLIGQMIHEAKNGDMPPLQYRLLHWDSRLTPTDVVKLSKMEIGGQQEAGSSEVGDATRGKVVFEKRCTGCHTIGEGREGPMLGGVFGRKAGSVAGFDYSAGLKNSGLSWDEATLEKWLKDPDLLVPKNNMDFQVPKAQERSDLIAYLKQQKDQH